MKLVVVSGPRAGEEIVVDGEQVIGRGEVDIVIDDPKLSRRHAVVRNVEGGLEVEDLGSLNGTEVDGRRIEEPVRLRGGERIRLCSTTIEVTAAEAQATKLEEAPAEATVLEESPAAPGAPATPAPAGQAPFSARAAGAPLPFATVFPRPAASLLWGPTLLCVVIIVAVAIAEVVYFALR